MLLRCRAAPLADWVTLLLLEMARAEDRAEPTLETLSLRWRAMRARWRRGPDSVVRVPLRRCSALMLSVD
eukprot:1648678-Prymnesium_polylepis.1